MTSFLLAMLAVIVLTAAALALLVAVTVVPFVRVVDAAERRGFSTARWGVAAGVGCLLALLLAAEAVRGPHLLLLVAALLAWVVPLALAVAGPHLARAGGRLGAHE